MKRVLIIVYYWPPSGGAGVQRWLKFAKYLPEFGWQPVIYTPENPDFQLKDTSLVQEVSPEVEVIKRPIWEPYGFYRNLFGKQKEAALSTGLKDKKGFASYLANWIRGNLFIPDPKVFWRKPSVRFLKKYLQESPVDLIVSSGTPHSMHLIAYDLKEALGIPWIADFRDPWSELDMLKDYHISSSRMEKYRKLEQMVLEKSDLALTTSEVWADDLKRLGADNSVCITNGYDEEDFSSSPEEYAEFVCSHFGLLNHLRNPRDLWKVLEELLEEEQQFADKFRLHLGGTIDSDIIEEIKSFPLLSARLKVFPYLSHEEVIDEYLKSSLLLLLLFNSNSGKGNIPGKLFEYLAAEKSILAFGPARGDSAKIVEEFGGLFLQYDHAPSAQLKEWILAKFKGADKSSKDPSQFSRRALTAKLKEQMEQLLSERP